MVNDAAELERELARLLADSNLRERMGAAARELIQRQQGATLRTLDEIDRVIERNGCRQRGREGGRPRGHGAG